MTNVILFPCPLGCGRPFHRESVAFPHPDTDWSRPGVVEMVACPGFPTPDDPEDLYGEDW